MEIAVGVRHCAVCLPPGVVAAAAQLYTLTETSIALQSFHSTGCLAAGTAACDNTFSERLVGG